MTSQPGLPSDTGDNTSPQQHYSVTRKDRDRVDLYTFSSKHMGDPALKVGNTTDYLSLNADVLPGLCHETQGSPPCTDS